MENRLPLLDYSSVFRKKKKKLWQGGMSMEGVMDSTITTSQSDTRKCDFF